MKWFLLTFFLFYPFSLYAEEELILPDYVELFENVLAEDGTKLLVYDAPTTSSNKDILLALLINPLSIKDNEKLRKDFIKSKMDHSIVLEKVDVTKMNNQKKRKLMYYLMKYLYMNNVLFIYSININKYNRYDNDMDIYFLFNTTIVRSIKTMVKYAKKDELVKNYYFNLICYTRHLCRKNSNYITNLFYRSLIVEYFTNNNEYIGYTRNRIAYYLKNSNDSLYHQDFYIYSSNSIGISYYKICFYIAIISDKYQFPESVNNSVRSVEKYVFLAIVFMINEYTAYSNQLREENKPVHPDEDF